MRIKHTCADWCHLMYHWRPNYLRKFDLCIQTPHNQHRWQREGMKILNRKGSLGQWHLLPSKWILDSLKVMRLLPYSVQLASDVWHHARCIVGNTTEFPNPKRNISQSLFLEPFDDSCMWKESRSYGLFSNWELSAFNFIYSSQVRAQILNWTQKM